MKVQRDKATKCWRYVCADCGRPLTGWYEPDEPYYTIDMKCAYCANCD